MEGCKLNDFEQLYLIKNNIENEMKKHKLFQLCKEDAMNTVFEKVGVLSAMMISAPSQKLQEYIKRKVATNATIIDEIDFIQESIKWIGRWSAIYCVDESIKGIKLFAEEIYDLMGLAYSYDQFYKMWDLHSNHVVKYRKFNNKLVFDYSNEENYKVHVSYDTLNRKKNESRSLEQIFNVTNLKSDFGLIEQAHRSDFDFGINFHFDGFDLNEYEIFSTALNNYIMEKTFGNTSNKVKIVVPGEEGVICYSKIKWIELMSSKSGLDPEIVTNIISFFTYRYDELNSDLSLTYFLPYKNDSLLLSEAIYNIQRPAVNALRILAKRQSKEYEREQNYFEEIQKKRIIDKINNKYLVAENITKEQKIRPGMDVLVYDKDYNKLQVIELKYKIPIESTRDTANLDKMLDKAYQQLESAKKIVCESRETIMQEYFGDEFMGVVPDAIDYFVITNFSIGTGMNCSTP
ncbi:MAG: hypothetical protein K0R50_2360 [Eubacterium sp.]|jgi:hypothetical protein|nr:hypothetical protein [Eubacterium sp.]